MDLMNTLRTLGWLDAGQSVPRFNRSFFFLRFHVPAVVCLR